MLVAGRDSSAHEPNVMTIVVNKAWRLFIVGVDINMACWRLADVFGLTWRGNMCRNIASLAT
jgi:hypothetical protein